MDQVILGNFFEEIDKIIGSVKIHEYEWRRFLYVNGVLLGTYLWHGENKKYENPVKWAKEQILKRNIVIERNITRIKKELEKWEQEYLIINNQ